MIDQTKIGGSDISAILGVNPYKSAIDVYQRIVEGVETPDTPQLRRGRLMEPVIRAMAVYEYGLELAGPVSLVDPRREWLRANLDDITRDGAEVQEFKSVSPWAAHEYGDGPDDIPYAHICQVQFYLAASEAPRGRLTALIGVDDLRTYVLESDAELQAMMLDAGERFWKDHVLPKRPPQPDGSERYSEYLKRKHAHSAGTTIQADAQLEQWVRQYREADLELEKWGAARRLARQRIETALGSAERAEGADWKLSWKTGKGRASTDWEEVVRAAGVPQNIIDAHTRRTPIRTFRLANKTAALSSGVEVAHEQ